jgi:hypothetical protein
MNNSVQLVCPFCSSSDVVKDGKTASGKQKIKCKSCGKRSVIKGDSMKKKALTDTPQVAPAVLEPKPQEPSEEVAETVDTDLPDVEASEPKKPAKKIAKSAEPTTPKTKPAKEKKPKVNDMYERGLYTAVRMSEEVEFETQKERKRFMFKIQADLANGKLDFEIEQLTGKRWRRVIKMADAHAYLAQAVPGWKPKS